MTSRAFYIPHFVANLNKQYCKNLANKKKKSETWVLCLTRKKKNRKVDGAAQIQRKNHFPVHREKACVHNNEIAFRAVESMSIKEN